MTSISENVISKYKNISTATIATCLFKRGFRNQFIQNVVPIHSCENNMIGTAYTLRYIPAREDLNSIEVFKDSKHLQRVAIEECPINSVLIIDSRKDARAASAGSILISRLRQKGVSGIVTDGGFRDTQEISDLEYPAYHQRPSAPTNLTLHHAIAINEPIACGDVAVFPNDLIIGDKDGVIVIPKHLAEEIADEALEMNIYEEFVLFKLTQGEKIIGLYPLVKNHLKEEFLAWKKNQ